MRKLIIVVALAFGLVLGCDGGDGGGADTAGGGQDTQLLPGDTLDGEDGAGPLPGDYPAPPYGETVGSIIDDHSFLIPGDDTMVRLSDYYQHATKRVLLINASAGWCGACKQEAGELNNVLAKYGPQGLDILYTLFEDWNGGPANEDFYNGWMAQYGGDYLTVLDPEFQMGIYFNVEATPMNMLVDLETMTIVWLETGFNPFALEAKLDELLQ
jgi:thiol-disulfide isomerase/thioredoxin